MKPKKHRVASLYFAQEAQAVDHAFNLKGQLPGSTIYVLPPNHDRAGWVVEIHLPQSGTLPGQTQKEIQP